MNALPVIERELRAECRHPFTYGLRLVGAGALMLGGLVFFSESLSTPAQQGLALFKSMHMGLLLAIWFFVPFVTADCISRERREGTLGLLFLTPPDRWDIVLAKALTHGWRAAALCLAVLPVLVMPALLGGLDARQWLASVAVLGASFVLSLSAGLLASSWTNRWHRALLLAWFLASQFFVFLAILQGWQFISLWNALAVPRGGWSPLAPGGDWLHYGTLVLLMPSGIFDGSLFLSGIPPSVRQAMLLPFFTILGGCFLFLPLALWLAARNVRRGWQDRPPSALALWTQRVFCSVILGRGLLKSWMNRYLERNPIGWLELRRWSGRLIAFGWVAALLSMLSLAFNLDRQFSIKDFKFTMHCMAWFLLASIALTAAGSFRRERETRLFELLLVTPLSLGQIVWGRLRGLLLQFLPAVVLLGGHRPVSAVRLRPRRDFGWAWYYGVSVATILFNGLYFSLRTHHLTPPCSPPSPAGCCPHCLCQMAVRIPAEESF